MKKTTKRAKRKPDAVYVVEIQVVCNQDPNRIARLVRDEIAKLAKLPRSRSPFTR